MHYFCLVEVLKIFFTLSLIFALCQNTFKSESKNYQVFKLFPPHLSFCVCRARGSPSSPNLINSTSSLIFSISLPSSPFSPRSLLTPRNRSPMYIFIFTAIFFPEGFKNFSNFFSKALKAADASFQSPKITATSACRPLERGS